MWTLSSRQNLVKAHRFIEAVFFGMPARATHLASLSWIVAVNLVSRDPTEEETTNSD